MVIFGRLLGSGLAAGLAAELQPDLTVLVSPYTSLPDLAAEHYPFPLQVDVRNNFTVAPLAPTSVSAGTGLIQAFNVHSANTTHVNNNTGAPIAGSPAVNAGDPEVIYTDLDLTRNDAGCYGGSYSRDNFDDALPTTAFVVFVDSPRRTQAALAIPITPSGIDR